MIKFLKTFFCPLSMKLDKFCICFLLFQPMTKITRKNNSITSLNFLLIIKNEKFLCLVITIRYKCSFFFSHFHASNGSKLFDQTFVSQIFFSFIYECLTKFYKVQ